MASLARVPVDNAQKDHFSYGSPDVTEFELG